MILEGENLWDIIAARGTEESQRLGWKFLHPHSDGQDWKSTSLSYGELHRNSLAVGALLQILGLSESRILLVFPPGLEFIVAFFGCIASGGIAVPAYPPDPARLEVSLSRLQSLVRDAKVDCILTTRSYSKLLDSAKSDIPEIRGLPLLVTEEVDLAIGSEWSDPKLNAERIAYLQYTSGSTSHPKGVVLTHSNVLQHCQQVCATLRPTRKSRSISWLPNFHDLGLLTSVVLPLFAGYESIMMSPLEFLQRPLNWLLAISQFRGSYSCAPNFAYELCVRRARALGVPELDLSCWRVAIVGADVIHSETLSSFTATFDRYGFEHAAFVSAYGLAEATLAVSYTDKEEEPSSVIASRSSLEEGNFVEAAVQSEETVSLASVGKALPEVDLRVVDPDSHVQIPDERVGEIWVSGPNVAQGYWNNLRSTRETFGWTLPGSRDEFLRTGDLGFLKERSLFFVGRIKDVIPWRGINIYAEDLEVTAERADPAIRPGLIAAFGVGLPTEEQVVVAVEVRVEEVANSKRISSAIASNVFRVHGRIPLTVVLLPPQSLPRTSSGKIRRGYARSQFIHGNFETVSVEAFS